MDELVDKIVHGDCLAVLKGISKPLADLIVTSPPYAFNRQETYGGIPVENYVEWFLPISAEMKRVLKPEGSLILNIKERAIDGQRGTYVYELVMEMKKQGWLWIEDYIWHKKNTPPGHWPTRFRDLWEHCYHFSKVRHFKMYQDAVKVPIGKWSRKRLVKLSETDKIRDNSKTLSGFAKNVSNWVGRDRVNPGNVLYLATESSNVNHSATYPVALPEWFIKLFTVAGDTVLDPFIGSGTTAIAAINLGRHYVGIELNEDYYKVSLQRIAEHSRQLNKN